MQELVRRLGKLSEASKAMTRCHDLGSLLDTILELVDDVFRLETCAVLLVDEATGELRVQRARGYDPEVVRGWCGTLGQGVTGRVARGGKAEFVADVRSDPDYVGGVSGAVSEMAAPMRLDGTVVGVLDAEIKVRAEPDGARMATVAIRDHGTGLNRDKLDKVFDPFYTTKPDGLGMGLSICRSIIEAHGGHLWAENNADGRGATFYFTVPVTKS